MSAVPFAMLRHAPTEWNAAGRLQGLTDTCLSRDGEAAARRWRLPRPADGWRRLSSPLQRARRTAELLQPFTAVTVCSDLREMSFGVWEGRTVAELRAAGGEARAVQVSGDAWPSSIDEHVRPKSSATERESTLASAKQATPAHPR